MAFPMYSTIQCGIHIFYHQFNLCMAKVASGIIWRLLLLATPTGADKKIIPI